MRRQFLLSRAVLLVLTTFVSLGVVTVAGQTPASSQRGTVPRTPDGHPDLQGIWNASTLTPFERPAAFKGKATVSEEEAKAFISRPQPTGDRFVSYNDFWRDRGSMLTRIDGQYRTSMVIDPPDGKVPPMTAEGQGRIAKMRAVLGGRGVYEANTFDDPEARPLSERCILGVGGAAGPPTLPTLYNNLRNIVQTRDHVMLLMEMNHDARIIPFGSPRLPNDMKQWMGDSVARWDGDSLVVETRNAREESRFRSASEDLRITERLTRVDATTLVYRFTIDDPKTWTRPWTGEYAWVKTDEPMLEYACHEANYALGDILRGARVEDVKLTKSK